MKKGGRPKIKVKGLDAKPFLEETPKSNGVAIIDKKVINGLQGLLAKGTIPAIWPTPLLQPVISPEPILKGESHKELVFWRSPKLPRRGGDWG
jgi:hypothetical protein